MRQIIQQIKWLHRLKRIDKVINEIDADMDKQFDIIDDVYTQLVDLHTALSLYYCYVYEKGE